MDFNPFLVSVFHGPLTRGQKVTFFPMIGGLPSILKVSVFHSPLTQGQKVTFFAVNGGFRSILLFL